MFVFLRQHLVKLLKSLSCKLLIELIHNEHNIRLLIYRAYTMVNMEATNLVVTILLWLGKLYFSEFNFSILI